MGLRIDQVNLNSFSKVFPLKSDVANVVLESIEETDSIIVTRSTSEDGEHRVNMHVKPATNNSIGGIMPGNNLEVDEDGVLSIGNASNSVAGVVTVGENIKVDAAGRISLEKTNNMVHGVVRVGENINVSDGTISVSKASKTGHGLVKVGDNIKVDDDSIISIDKASKSNHGIIKVGENIHVNPDGVISLERTDKNKLGLVQVGNNINVSDGVISVDKASKTMHGLVKVGDNINVSEDGTISIQPEIVPESSKTNKGIVQVGTNLDVTSGIISVKTGSKTDKGVLQVGKNLEVSNGIISSDVNKAYVDSEVTKLNTANNSTNARIDSLVTRIDAQQTKINELKDALAMLQEYQLTSSQLMLEMELRITLLEKMVAEEIATIRPLKNGNIYIGQVTLNGYGISTQVNLPSRVFTNTDYRVVLSPNSATEGAMGEYWIEDKTPFSFIIANTGSATMVKCDFLLIPNEKGSLPFNKDTFPYQKGKGQFNGTEGRTVTLPNALPDTEYAVLVLPSLNENVRAAGFGNLGEYWVSDKTRTSFKVYNSGSDTQSFFDYVVIKTGSPEYHPINNPITEGHGVFGGPNTVVNLETDINSSNYSVIITPSENPGGDLGEYWITGKTPNSFVVHNTGSAKTKFDYAVIG